MEDTKRTRPSDLLSKAYMRSQRLKQQVQGLHGSIPGPQHKYYSFQISVLWHSWVLEWASNSCAYSLGFFSFCWTALSSLDMMFWVSSYILFCHDWLLSPRSFFFLMRQKGCGSRWRRMGDVNSSTESSAWRGNSN